MRFQPSAASNINSKDVAWLAASKSQFFDDDNPYAPIDTDSDTELQPPPQASPRQTPTRNDAVEPQASTKRQVSPTTVSPRLSANDASPRKKEDDTSARTKAKRERRKKRGRSDNAKLAGAKAIYILTKIDENACLSCGPGSCYGAAIAIPQISRSIGWPVTMIGISLNTYFLLLLNYVFQGFVLCMIGMEMHFMFPFAERMHLCDFGADIPQCPKGPNCRGPGGTTFTFPRLFGFETWNTRTFVRDALVAIFPDMKEKIGVHADPGEFGLENYWIRALCVCFFVMSLVPDLHNNIELIRLHRSVPTRAESWASYEVPDWDTKANVKKRDRKTELDFVMFRVAGMPLHWKWFNFFAVLLPKCFIWLAMARSGVHYLMETAGIIDVIVNSMALSFVLNIDEMLFERLSRNTTQHMMKHLQPYALFDIGSAETESDEAAMDQYELEELACARCFTRFVKAFVPWDFVWICVLQFLLMACYYERNCDRTADGGWISKAVFSPKDLSFDIWGFINGDVAAGSTLMWSVAE